ncbi:MAG: ABC transporter substrate-binding protein [Spirochaetia bacterium]|nr:ABC transporter substrate-binding protein [Spirochaetia bacterium]
MKIIVKKCVTVFFCALVATLGLSAQGNAEKSDSEIVIGCIQDTTGPTSTMGKMVEEGALYAIDEVNAAGGINGKTIKMITYDTKGDVNEAINAYTRAVSTDKVKAIIGPPIANIALAIAPISEKYSVPIIGLGVDPKCQQKTDGTTYKNMFCLQPSTISQGTIMADYAIKERGCKTFGIIYNESNAYSVSLVDPFLNAAEKAGATIVDKVSYNANDKDFKTLLNDMISAKVDAIYSPGYTQEIILITQQARALGYKGDLIFGLDACPPFNTLLGEDADGIYFINNYDASDPKLVSIINDMKQKKNLDITNKFFLGYDIGKVIAQSFTEVGTDSKAVRDYIEHLTNFKGMTGDITIDPATHFPTGLKMVMYTYKGTTPVMLEHYSAD